MDRGPADKEGRAVGHVIGKFLGEFQQLMKQRKVKEAEAVLDRALKRRPLPPEENDSARTEVGISMAPRGSQEQLETLLKEFYWRVKIAQLEWDVYYRRSDDAGKTWSNEQRLVGVPGLSHRPNMAVSGSELHLVWWDNRQGNDEVYYEHSADGGRSWGNDIRLTNTAAASQFPMVATTKSGPHLIWTEQRDGGSQVFHKRPKQ